MCINQNLPILTNPFVLRIGTGSYVLILVEVKLFMSVYKETHYEN